MMGVRDTLTRKGNQARTINLSANGMAPENSSLVGKQFQFKTIFNQFTTAFHVSRQNLQKEHVEIKM